MVQQLSPLNVVEGTTRCQFLQSSVKTCLRACCPCCGEVSEASATAYVVHQTRKLTYHGADLDVFHTLYNAYNAYTWAIKTK